MTTKCSHILQELIEGTVTTWMNEQSGKWQRACLLSAIGDAWDRELAIRLREAAEDALARQQAQEQEG